MCSTQPTVSTYKYQGFHKIVVNYRLLATIPAIHFSFRTLFSSSSCSSCLLLQNGCILGEDPTQEQVQEKMLHVMRICTPNNLHNVITLAVAPWLKTSSRCCHKSWTVSHYKKRKFFDVITKQTRKYSRDKNSYNCSIIELGLFAVFVYCVFLLPVPRLRWFPLTWWPKLLLHHEVVLCGVMSASEQEWPVHLPRGPTNVQCYCDSNTPDLCSWNSQR